MSKASQVEKRLIRREHIRQMVSDCFNHTGMTKVLEWHNPEEERLYSLLIGKDLFGDVTVDRQWCSCVTKQGHRKRSITCESKIGDVVTMIDGLLKRRLVHGYELITAVDFELESYSVD